MAVKPITYSKWGRLKDIGVSEDQLLSVVAGDRSEDVEHLPVYPPGKPTYGVIIELYLFANNIASSLSRKPNRILKCWMDVLFPNFTVSRADRLERRIKNLYDQTNNMVREELDEFLEKPWNPQPTGKSERFHISDEMIMHGLGHQELEQIISRPGQTRWMLTVAPSKEFYSDLHDVLKKKRVPVDEIGAIYRSIDPELLQTTTSHKEAYAKVQDMVGRHSNTNSKPKLNNSGTCADNSGRFAIQNVKCREKRAKTKMVRLQNTLNSLRKMNKAQGVKVDNLTAALEDVQSLVHERNVEIKHLQSVVRNHELTIDLLEDELTQMREQTDQRHTQYESEIADLIGQIKQLEGTPKKLATFSSRTYSSNVRALYYTLLAMKIPPAQIKTVIRNVICHLVPSIQTDDLRLPGKSCANYMRSQEMPTISEVQKASELMQEKQWHLNSDGTTLMQQKKLAFLINGLVFGIHDVPDGSSQVALDCLKAELAKTSTLAATISQDDKHLQEFNIDHIVSSTSDSASTQTKFNKLLEEETGNQIVQNKCGMHLGVNLRLAQVKAASRISPTDCVDDNLYATLDSDAECELKDESDMQECSSSSSDQSQILTYEEITEDVGSCDDSNDWQTADSQSSGESDPGEPNSAIKIFKNPEYQYPVNAVASQKILNSDIDLFVHELAKLFGHLGTPEYCHGASTFHVFLADKVEKEKGVKKEYYQAAQDVVLKRQVGSRYYVTSCNAGRLYFLRVAMVAFLNEQKSIKHLNRLESMCLQKLKDPLMLSTLKLEGLMYDKVYADLMTLVKSSELQKTALDINVHYQELLEFFDVLTTKPLTLLNEDTEVFISEPRLYSKSSTLNHRLSEKYIAVRKELHSDSDRALLLPMIVAASKAMKLKLQSYMKDHLPGGRYHEPDPKIGSILSTLQPHNDKVESVFGANDWLNRILPNLAQSTRSTMLEFSYNKTMEWLKSQGEEQKQNLIALAQNRRKVVQMERKEEAKCLFERKLEERREALKKRHELQKRKEKHFDDIKDEHLINSVEELNHRVACITSLSLPRSVQDAEIKKMVQRQVQLRKTVFGQDGIKINLTEKGKPRPVSELQKNLSKVICERPVHVRRKKHHQQTQQILYTVFEKPSLLKRVKIRHRFDENGSLHWYEGNITAVRGSMLTVYYKETDEHCQFTLGDIKEDFT